MYSRLKSNNDLLLIYAAFIYLNISKSVKSTDSCQWPCAVLYVREEGRKGIEEQSNKVVRHRFLHREDQLTNSDLKFVYSISTFIKNVLLLHTK